MGRLGLVVTALGVAACAPITTHTHVAEHINGKHDKISAPIRSETVATIDAGQAELAVQISDRDTCTTHEIESVSRVRQSSRSVNKPVLVLEYGLGIILGGAGGFALADPADAVTLVNNATPTTRDNVVLAGEGAAAVGGLFLLSAIINSTRGGDSSTKLPDEDREIGTPRETPCGEHPLAARTMILVADARTAVLPPTDAAGHTAATWDGLAAAMFEGAAPPSRGDLHLGDAAGPVVGHVELVPARQALIDREWKATVTAGTARAAAAFAVRFPAAHDADVAAKIAAVGDAEMDALVGAAIDRADFAGARALMPEWTTLVATSSLRTARETTLADRERDAKIAELVGAIDGKLAAPGDPADLAPITSALSLVSELATLAPNDVRTPVEQAKVAAARTARQAQLLQRAQDAEKANELADAVSLAGLAVEVMPTDLKAQKARDDLHKRVARRYAADARLKTRTRAFPDAEVAMSKAEALLPADREVVAARKALVAAQAAADAAIADAAERGRRKAAREQQQAELIAARAAERAKAEADRVAAADERKRKDDEARAARDAKHVQDEADRLAAAEAARVQREADKNAAEVARLQRAGEKSAAEALRKQQEADKLAAAKLAHDREAADKLAAAKAAHDREVAAAKAAGTKLPTPKPTPSSKSGNHTGAGTNADPLHLGAALAGVWSATGRAAQGRVSLLLETDVAGRGSLTIVGPTGRSLGRQAVTWSVDRDKLTMTGGTLRGPAVVRGDAMTWTGFAWKRVAGRTVAAAGARARTPKPPHN